MEGGEEMKIKGWAVVKGKRYFYKAGRFRGLSFFPTREEAEKFKADAIGGETKQVVPGTLTLDIKEKKK